MNLLNLQVCFSDESSIQILQDNSQFVRRRPNEKYDESCVVERVKHPLSVMIWGVISSKGNGRLHLVEGTMRQNQHLRLLVLETRHFPQMAECYPDGDCIFMQDSTPCYKAYLWQGAEFCAAKNF